ncbi:MAG TPA: prolyl oligopeptidase family serine peptidase [Gemmataceae bacterium]|jgi:dienelactone hydrolase
MRRLLVSLPLLAAVGLVEAQPPAPKTKLARPSEHAQATADIHEFFRRATRRLADACLADVKSPADWHRVRPQLRQQLFEMLGLSPLPERTPLHPTVTGTTDGDMFVVEKLHFQSRPGLYVTANFYRPKQIDKRLPTILYVCGHSNVEIDGVAYGAKAAYQHHAGWFARHGYCCLVLDTLQLGEIEGVHHGTYRLGMWWWVSRGYTPAGVEAWNCIRALDYLETRPEVDAKRIGVTGRSGGGAYTWWTAALDDRPACFVPVAGITDLQNHVVDGCVEGHCDCMYMVNTYGWDFAAVAALAAPRPLLFSNSDKDNIFPLDGVYRTHAKLKRIYQLHNATDKLGLLITEGPHKDTQDLQVPAFRWFARWLKGLPDEHVTQFADKLFTPQQLKVFAELPADQKNTTIHETFTPKAEPPPVPASKEEWEKQRDRLLAELREKCFRNWPAAGAPLDAKVTIDTEANGLKLQAIEFTSEENLRFPVYVVRGAKHAEPSLLVLTPVDTAEWQKWLAEMAPAFAEQLPGGKAVEPNAKSFVATARLLDRQDWAFAVLPPRGEGPNRWDPDPKKDTHIRRRFVLLGRTADDGQVWDVLRALAALRSRDELKGARPWVQGTGRMAGIALYAGLFHPAVERFDLHDLPASHRDGPTFLNVLRVLDVPQAVALAYPRKVMLYGADADKWSWTAAAAKVYGEKGPLQMREPPKSE